MKFSVPCELVVSWEELAREQSMSFASGFAFGFTTKPPSRFAMGMLALLYRASGSDSGVHSKRVATLKEGPIGIRDSCAAYASFISADPSLPGVAALAGNAVPDSTIASAIRHEPKRSNFLFSLVKHILSFLFSQMHLINRAEPGNFAESTLLFPLRFGTYNDDAALDSNRTVRDYTSKRFHSMHSKILSQGSGWAFP